MMNTKLPSVDYKTLINITSEQKQIDICIEEMSELTHALLKARRAYSSISIDVCKELVHVEMCMECLYTIISRYESDGLLAKEMDAECERKEIIIASRIAYLKSMYPGDIDD